jgi:hypothetical protein
MNWKKALVGLSTLCMLVGGMPAFGADNETFPPVNEGSSATLPQDLDTTDSPSFAGLTLTDNIVVDTNGKGITFKRGATLLDSGSNAATLTGALTVSGLLTAGTLSSGAGGLTSDADGDVVAKSLTLSVTPLALGSGGSGASSAATAPWALKGANSDITSLSALSTAIPASGGGTGNTTGAGLVGGTSSANDTSGTVTLTASSAHTRFFNQGASALTYELPACTAEARGLWVFRSTGTGTGDVTLDPAAGDAIGGLSANTNFQINATVTANLYWVLFCDGVANWVWIKEPTQSITYQSAGMLMTGSGGIITSSGAPTGQLLSANNMTSATSLVSVGTITTGTWDGTDVAVTAGGTGSSTGAGLIGAYGSANDTSGTVTLTATSARVRYFDQGSSTLNYDLPPAASVPLGVFYFAINISGTNSGDVSWTPNGAETINGTAAAWTITDSMGLGSFGALMSDGVSGWIWITPFNNIYTSGAGIVAKGTTTSMFTKVSTLSSSQLSSAVGLTAVGALDTGSIASGFGTISTGNNITTTATLTGGTFDLTADTVDLADGGTGSSTAAGARTNLEVNVFTDGTDQTITSAGALTRAHSLGRTPKEVWWALVCQTDEAGYTAGQVIFYTPTQVTTVVGNTNGGHSVIVDGTNLTVRFGSSTSVYSAPHATTGVATDLTNANWKLRLYAR